MPSKIDHSFEQIEKPVVDPISATVKQLKRLPGIGEKSALRLVYWMLRAPGNPASDIASALGQLGDGVRECQVCCTWTPLAVCGRCSRVKRNDALLVVVEQPQDVEAFERSGEFQGRYHVLHGAISPLDGVTPDRLRIRELLERLRGDVVQEVIVATNPTVEGDATALYLARLLGPIGVLVTRLAHGISVGSEIEFADSASLARAFHNRRAFNE